MLFTTWSCHQLVLYIKDLWLTETIQWKDLQQTSTEERRRLPWTGSQKSPILEHSSIGGPQPTSASPEPGWKKSPWSTIGVSMDQDSAKKNAWYRSVTTTQESWRPSSPSATDFSSSPLTNPTSPFQGYQFNHIEIDHPLKSYIIAVFSGATLSYALFLNPDIFTPATAFKSTAWPRSIEIEQRLIINWVFMY